MKRFLLSAVCLLCLVSVCGAQAPIPSQSAVGWGPAQSTASPVQLVGVALSATEATQPQAATANFKAALNEAASRAYKAGEITRWQLASVRLAIVFRGKQLAEVQAAVVDQAVTEAKLPRGADANVNAIDWTSILAFIQQLMPFILQLIALFGG